MARQPTTRQYPGSDANMIQQANVNMTVLSDNLAAFTAKDPEIDATYVTDYAADIADAEEVDSDELVEDTLKLKTQTVKAAQKEIADLVQDARYYVKAAFPDNVAVQQQFGLDVWDKKRQSQTGTLQFLTKMHTMAVEYQTQLTAAGFTAANTAAILTKRQALEDADSEQEVYRSGRPELTAQRLEKYNKVFARMTRVNALAQIVFRDSYEMRKQFVFNPSGSGDDSDTYEGTLAASETKTIATLTYGASTPMVIENRGTTNLEFSLRVTEADPSGIPLDVAAAAIFNLTMADLNDDPAATFLVVKNVGATEGAYRVVVG